MTIPGVGETVTFEFPATPGEHVDVVAGLSLLELAEVERGLLGDSVFTGDVRPDLAALTLYRTNRPLTVAGNVQGSAAFLSADRVRRLWTLVFETGNVCKAFGHHHESAVGGTDDRAEWIAVTEATALARPGDDHGLGACPATPTHLLVGLWEAGHDQVVTRPDFDRHHLLDGIIDREPVGRVIRLIAETVWEHDREVLDRLASRIDPDDVETGLVARLPELAERFGATSASQFVTFQRAAVEVANGAPEIGSLTAAVARLVGPASLGAAVGMALHPAASGQVASAMAGTAPWLPELRHAFLFAEEGTLEQLSSVAEWALHQNPANLQRFASLAGAAGDGNGGSGPWLPRLTGALTGVALLPGAAALALAAVARILQAAPNVRTRLQRDVHQALLGAPVVGLPVQPEPLLEVKLTTAVVAVLLSKDF